MSNELHCHLLHAATSPSLHVSLGAWMGNQYLGPGASPVTIDKRAPDIRSTSTTSDPTI